MNDLNVRRHEELANAVRIMDAKESMWGWSTPAGQLRARRRLDLVSAGCRVVDGESVLEVGCGTGYFTSQWRLPRNRIIAVDISYLLLRAARERYPHLTFIVADITALPFRHGSLGGVIGSSILHHLDESAVYPEFKRVLKPDREMVFAEPNMLNPQIFLQKTIPLLKRLAGDTPHETAFARFPLAKRLAAAGFDRIEITPFDFLHPLAPAFLIGIIDLMGRILEKIPGIREIAGSLLIRARKPDLIGD